MFFLSEFHQLENNLHISQYLADTRETLHNMLRTGSISEDIMISLNIVTDCCYAWNIMESFVDVMQASIKGNPPTVIKLKALFLKVNKYTIKIHITYALYGYTLHITLFVDGISIGNSIAESKPSTKCGFVFGVPILQQRTGGICKACFANYT